MDKERILIKAKNQEELSIAIIKNSWSLSNYS